MRSPVLLALFVTSHLFVFSQEFVPLENLSFPYSEEMEVRTEEYVTTDEVYVDLSVDPCYTNFQWITTETTHSRTYIVVEGKAVPYHLNILRPYFERDPAAMKYFNKATRNNTASFFLGTASAVSLIGGTAYALSGYTRVEGDGETTNHQLYEDPYHYCPNSVQTWDNDDNATTYEADKVDTRIVIGLLAAGVGTGILYLVTRQAYRDNMDEAFRVYNSNVGRKAYLIPQIEFTPTNTSLSDPTIGMGFKLSF